MSSCSFAILVSWSFSVCLQHINVSHNDESSLLGFADILSVFVSMLMLIACPSLAYCPHAAPKTFLKYFLKLVVVNAYTNGLIHEFPYAKVRKKIFHHWATFQFAVIKDRSHAVMILNAWIGAQQSAKRTTTMNTIRVIFFFLRNERAWACALSVPPEVFCHTWRRIWT